MKKLIFYGLLLFLLPATALDLDSLKLHHAVLKNGLLHFDGNSSMAELPDSSGMNLDNRGMTILLTLKAEDRGEDIRRPEGLDMYVFKPDQFLFGRLGNRLYINFHDGSKFVAHTLGNRIPVPGRWTQLVAVFEPYDNAAQGDKGFILSVYLDGECCGQRKFRNFAPKSNSNPVEIGRGWGGPWHFKGEIAELQILRGVLSEGEINAALGKNRLVKVRRSAESSIRLSPAEWLRRSFDRAPQAVAGKIRDELAEAFSADAPDILERFGSERHGVRLLKTSALRILVMTGSGSGHPLLGVYDVARGYDVFDGSAFQWNLEARKGTTLLRADSASLPCRTAVVDNRIEAVWETASPFPFRAVSILTVRDGRIEADLKIDNMATDVLLFDVTFPCTRLNRIADEDFLMYPWMCGVEVADPTVKRFIYGQSGWYPSGMVSMAFSAYYGGGRGAYFGWEDPSGKTCHYQVSGKNNVLEFQWRHPVAFDVGARGGNSFVSSGRSAVELYDGGWFEAAQIYRACVEKSAVWWLKTLPRTSTPEWYRDSVLWLSCYTPRTPAALQELVDELFYLRQYFDLPVGIHWYEWDDIQQGAWPHFHIKSSLREPFRQLAAHGIYVKPYTNPRLWKQLDGPGGKTELSYRTEGVKAAVKNADSTIPSEDYTDGRFSVMCPASPDWQKLQLRVVGDIRGLVPACYHDQAATAFPIPCFDPAHGHKLNDPSMWLDLGFRPLMEKLRRMAPGMVFDTEEISEPYVNLYDGALVWRWTFAGQLPVFQSIYSGRIQFVGRTVDNSVGDPEAGFVKLATMLVNAEQIGRFQVNVFQEPDMFRLYAKKLAHLRLALARHFNTGRMRTPLKFKTPPEMASCLWGSHLKPQKLTAPKIISNSYDLPTGRMYLFLNTVAETVEVKPDIGTGTLYRCLEGAAAMEPVDASWPVRLGPHQSEVRFTSAEDARALQQAMRKIAGFDCGKNLLEVAVGNRQEKQLTAVPGRMFMPTDSSWSFSCDNNLKTFGGINTGSVISYGIVDFGRAPVEKLILRASVHPDYSGGMIEILTALDGKQESVAGVLTLNSTGGWFEYQDISLKLRRPLQGKSRLLLRFKHNGCCNFVGWKTGDRDS